MHDLPMTQSQGVYLSIAIVVLVISVNVINSVVLYYKVYRLNNELKIQLEKATRKCEASDNVEK